MAFIEIIAEFFKDSTFIYATKPFLMPVLLLLYLTKSNQKNLLFIGSFIFVWIANIQFISNTPNSIFWGSVFFLIYRIFVILLAFRLLKFPGYFPLILGCLPFLFIYLFVANIIYNDLEQQIYLFIIQGIFTIVFGGYCLGNYIFKSNKSNTYLLISTMLFTITQFILVLKNYYISFNIFQPMAMLLFVFGQYFLYLFVIEDDKKKTRFLIINKNKNREQ